MLPIARHTRASLELRDSFYDLVKIQYSETACQEDFIDRHCLGENSRLRDCFVENSRPRDCCAKKSRLRDVENRSKNETARRLKISQNFARPLFFERPFATPDIPMCSFNNGLSNGSLFEILYILQGSFQFFTASFRTACPISKPSC